MAGHSAPRTPRTAQQRSTASDETSLLRPQRGKSSRQPFLQQQPARLTCARWARPSAPVHVACSTLDKSARQYSGCLFAFCGRFELLTRLRLRVTDDFIYHNGRILLFAVVLCVDFGIKQRERISSVTSCCLSHRLCNDRASLYTMGSQGQIIGM